VVSIFGRLVPKELFKIFVAWAIVSAIAIPLVWFFLGPHLPPGTMSSSAADQQFDNTVLVVCAIPVAVFLAIYFVYCLVRFRHRGTTVEDGPPLRGDGRVVAAWIAATSALVLFLAGWGSWELFPGEHGAGGGQGPDPLQIATPAKAASALQVQVIGQQWQWTYRYPQYGFESDQLVLPQGQLVEFHVTSLDVVHSFWAIQLGVKADAVPGTDNVAFTQPNRVGSFQVRCAELCGIWHGHMFTEGRVMTESDFQSWAQQQKQELAPASSSLPPYAPSYYPEPLTRGG
jgi:cytochrome c oxidase subunit 2